jgi:amidase
MDGSSAKTWRLHHPRMTICTKTNCPTNHIIQKHPFSAQLTYLFILRMMKPQPQSPKENMTSSKPLWQWSACDLATAIKRRDISCEETVAASLDRMNEVNPHLNAIVISLAEEARAEATSADAAVKAGKEIGPLHGVPVTIKVNVDIKGKPNSNGVPALAENIAPEDSPVVHNLKKAGAIIIGITNTPEFSFRMVTDNPLFGLTRNPWHDDFTCGGSSGGAASATAAGISPIAHGNDIGGSLRIPAFCCGVPTIRPTQGRVPAYNPSQLEDRSISAQLMSVQGPIAREVRDVRLALSAMAQFSPYDPWWVPAPMEGPPIDTPVRVAVTRSLPNTDIDPVISQAIDKAAGYLADAGYQVEEVSAPFTEELFQLWISLLISETKQLQGAVMQEMASDDFNHLFENLYAHTKFLDLDGYMRGLAKRTSLLREWLLFLEKYPLVLAPLLLSPKYPIGFDICSVEETGKMLRTLFGSCSVNALGLPAVTAPIDLHEGVPHGVQIIGQKYREDLCLDAAEEIEKRVGILPRQLWEKI